MELLSPGKKPLSSMQKIGVGVAVPVTVPVPVVVLVLRFTPLMSRCILKSPFPSGGSGAAAPANQARFCDSKLWTTAGQQKSCSRHRDESADFVIRSNNNLINSLKQIGRRRISRRRKCVNEKLFVTATAATREGEVQNSPSSPISSSIAPAEAEEMVTEDEAGILCYMNALPGFQGILKQRYSDFVVNEVSSSGAVIRLTNLDPPAEEAVPTNLEASFDGDADPAIDVTSKITAFEHSPDLEAFRVLAGDQAKVQLQAFLRSILGDETEHLASVMLPPDSDKAHRAAVHNFFKSKLPFLETDTVDGPGDTTRSKCIRIRDFSGRGTGGGGGRPGRQWSNGSENNGSGRNPKRQRRARPRRDDPSLQKLKFLLFHLFKENKNTQDALMVVGRMLGVQPKSFGFAGTKDKRAVTTQQVTVFKQSAAKLASLNSKLMGIKVGNFSYAEKSLGLGELSGNRFTITLRNVLADDDTIAEAAEGLKENGFVNYFGLQRFGNTAVSTHAVGAALLRGEWHRAVDLILQPRNGEIEEIAEARKHFEKTGDVGDALLRFPRHLGSERAVLGGLKKYPGNWLTAFNCIARPMRLMFVHSYQSYLWNYAASYRLRTYGARGVVEGDLVLCEESEQDSLPVNVKKSACDEDQEALSAGEDLDVLDPTEHEGIQKVKVITAKDISDYSIFDVVLPLPGSAIIYPANSTAKVYQELASKDAVDLASSPHAVKDYSISQLTGGYRRLVQKPKDFQWKILTYQDVTQPLSATDLDEIMKSTKEGDTEGDDREHVSAGDTQPTSASSLENRSRKALQLSFTLPAASYATMAIRELLKTSTSVAFHKTLNDE